MTEYFPHGTLFDSPGRYRGPAMGALTAFRSLVETVAGSLDRDASFTVISNPRAKASRADMQRCTHTIYFTPHFPEEAASRGWKVI